VQVFLLVLVLEFLVSLVWSHQIGQ